MSCFRSKLFLNPTEFKQARSGIAGIRCCWASLFLGKRVLRARAQRSKHACIAMPWLSCMRCSKMRQLPIPKSKNGIREIQKAARAHQATVVPRFQHTLHNSKNTSWLLHSPIISALSCSMAPNCTESKGTWKLPDCMAASMLSSKRRWNLCYF